MERELHNFFSPPPSFCLSSFTSLRVYSLEEREKIIIVPSHKYELNHRASYSKFVCIEFNEKFSFRFSIFESRKLLAYTFVTLSLYHLSLSRSIQLFDVVIVFRQKKMNQKWSKTKKFYRDVKKSTPWNQEIAGKQKFIFTCIALLSMLKFIFTSSRNWYE